MKFDMLYQSFEKIISVLAMPIQKRFLFANFEGGGNTPPMLAIVRKLIEQGHEVRVLSDLCNQDEAQGTGASFTAWKRIPTRADKSAASDPIKDWEVKSPVAMLARLRDRLFVGPALSFAQDLLDEVKQFRPDVVVTSEMLWGVMAGAEAAGLPCVILSPNIFFYPLPGVPAFGPGFLPAKGKLGRIRDALVRKFSWRIFAKGTAEFNAARHALGLPPLNHPLEQLERVTKHLVMTSPAFDFPATCLPKHVVYTGPEIEDPPWVEPWTSPWSCDDSRPLLIVAFSTTFQNHVSILRNVISALAPLDIRAIVTLGPAIVSEDLPMASNIVVCRSAPHSELLPEAAMVITHAGHGTVIRALAAGVPVLCMPIGRDQNDNAARVVARGAGLRLRWNAGPSKIRKATVQILRSPEYRARAQQLGNRILDDARHSSTVQILEGVAVMSAVSTSVL